jgi:hypothetical protein
VLNGVSNVIFAAKVVIWLFAVGVKASRHAIQASAPQGVSLRIAFLVGNALVAAKHKIYHFPLVLRLASPPLLKSYIYSTPFLLAQSEEVALACPATLSCSTTSALTATSPSMSHHLLPRFWPI